MVQHLRCRHIREKDIVFDSHMSGFVYKVRVGGQTLIKKEIPGPDTVEEFLYEVNALNSLRLSSNTIAFHGVVVDDEDQSVKGLLIDYAEKGALIDIIYDAQEHGLDLPWSTREKWAQQIVQGLSDIHEAGFVQGDFTLSNIVIDRDDNAKIIDINRRGCPVGWEPPEATPLIESNQRISMYIGVKSDLYQLGMVLWALAMLEDEPEHHRRPLHLDPEIEVPKWYRRMVENCLNHNPRIRLQATALLAMFPDPSYDDYGEHDLPSISVDDGRSVKQYTVEGFGHRGLPVIRTVTPQSDTYFPKVGYQSELSSPGLSDDAYYYPPRGRSPPSPLPSNLDDCDAGYLERNVTWSEHQTAPSVSDVGPDESQARTPRYTGSAEVHEITKQLEGALNSIETKPNEFYGGRDSAYEEVHVTELETSDGAVATHKIVIEEADAVPRPEISYKDTIAEDLTPTGINIESGAWHLIKSSGGHEASATKEDEPQQAATHGGSNDSNTAQEPTTRKSPLLLQSCNLTDEDDALDSEHLRHGKDAAYTPAFEVADSYEPQSRPIHGPVSNAANDLTGIGSGHNTQDDFRNPICSDEDLGIIGATSRNVASQA